jgi:hypothetical protein
MKLELRIYRSILFLSGMFIWKPPEFEITSWILMELKKKSYPILGSVHGFMKNISTRVGDSDCHWIMDGGSTMVN